MPRKRRKNDLLDDVMDQGIAHAGLMGIGGAASKLPASPLSGQIMGSMGMLNVPLKVRAMGTGLKQLQHIERKVKKKRKY